MNWALLAWFGSIPSSAKFSLALASPGSLAFLEPVAETDLAGSALVGHY